MTERGRQRKNKVEQRKRNERITRAFEALCLVIVSGAIFALIGIAGAMDGGLGWYEGFCAMKYIAIGASALIAASWIVCFVLRMRG